jgi:hypothetical protein
LRLTPCAKDPLRYLKRRPIRNGGPLAAEVHSKNVTFIKNKINQRKKLKNISKEMEFYPKGCIASKIRAYNGILGKV